VPPIAFAPCPYVGAVNSTITIIATTLPAGDHSIERMA
jgi:hypothetical protein